MKQSSKLIILADNQVLVRKFKRPSGEEVFDLPGGKVELGETPEEAAVREGIEELGLKVLNPKFIYRESVREIDTEGFFFLATDYVEGFEKSPEKDTTVGEEVWMSTAEALSKLSFKVCINALTEAIK